MKIWLFLTSLIKSLKKMSLIYEVKIYEDKEGFILKKARTVKFFIL